MGEAWHHNHHAFPRSAAHGLGRCEIDLSACVIRVMEKVGLAWNVSDRARAPGGQAGRRAAKPAPARRCSAPPPRPSASTAGVS